MNEDDEQRIAARLARIMAMMCNCNSKLEDLHARCPPVTRTGDYSDVFVLDADGQRTPWPEVSRVDDIEMRDLMRQIVNRLYAFHIRADDPALRNESERWLPLIDKWDEPSEDSGFLGNNATIKEGLAEAAGLGSDHPNHRFLHLAVPSLNGPQSRFMAHYWVKAANPIDHFRDTTMSWSWRRHPISGSPRVPFRTARKVCLDAETLRVGTSSTSACLSPRTREECPE